MSSSERQLGFLEVLSAELDVCRAWIWFWFLNGFNEKCGLRIRYDICGGIRELEKCNPS